MFKARWHNVTEGAYNVQAAYDFVFCFTRTSHFSRLSTSVCSLV